MKNIIKLTESQFYRIIEESVNKVLKEGWVNQTKDNIDDIFQDIISRFSKTDILRKIGENDSPYQFFSDYIKDYYNISLQDSDLICNKLKEYYKLPYFYASEKRFPHK